MSSAADPADWIEHAARDHPAQVFMKTLAGRHYSYASLRSETGRFAAALMRRGVSPGDRVVVQVDKCAEAVLLYIACLRMGAVFVPRTVRKSKRSVKRASPKGSTRPTPSRTHRLMHRSRPIRACN
jgi:acyl-CoA synthetase (AMP-forming)/AMP-acid ligase II